MAHSLKFSTVHKSIVSFDEITLPKFVVITGVNGSGKTHLLTAIQEGKVVSSLVANIDSDVRLFDSANIVPADTGVFDPAQDQSRRSQWFQTIESFRTQQFTGLQNYVLNLGIPSSLCITIEKIAKITPELISEVMPECPNTEQIWQQIQAHIRALGSNVAANAFNNIGDDFWRKNAPVVALRSPELFMLSSRSEFFRDENFLWGDVDPFQQAFGQVFVTYRALIHENDRLEKYPPPGNNREKFLGPEQFEQEYGSRPWDFVNHILETSNLNFRVDSPPLHETGSYEPKLVKITNDVEMRFQDLSSGEKVLMSFALCLYNSREVRQVKSFPKLLLLDEVDAPLHPSMAASLLKTIHDVLVKERNVCVIMTTHSPSTVALAPEEAIYAMDPNGPRLVKTTKGEALTLLTAGVPTLSVSFSGRRQVFVESRTDASLYDSLYQKFKGKLNSERSLAFVEVGHSNEGGLEQSGGCEQVKRLVNTLAGFGNETVFGLVDWDNHQSSTARVHVLSPNVRDGLESLLFDPLLMVALISRENISFAHQNFILDAHESYISLPEWTSSRWQEAVDRLQDYVLDSSIGHSNDTVTVKYLSGITLELRTAYLRMDDHALEALLLSRFMFLRAHNRRAGGLMRHVVDTVLSEFAVFVPTDLLDTFRNLLMSEVN